MAITKSKIFFFSCLSFIIGIGIGSYFPDLLSQGRIIFFFLIVLSVVCLLIFWKKPGFRLLFFMLLFFFGALFRFEMNIESRMFSGLDAFENQKMSFIGQVASEPDRRKESQKLEIEVIRLSNAAPSVQKSKILVTADLYPPYAYSDILEIKCKIKKPEAFNGFAYDRYLARYDIFYVCAYPQIKKIGKNTNYLPRLIFQFKNNLAKKINSGLAEPEASLARALILGDSRNFSPDLRAVFSQSGLSHVMAISGLHISIFSILIMSLLINLGISRRYSFYFAVFFLVFYIFLIGAPASAVRSGIMGGLALYALKIGRLSRIENSLFFAAALMLLINPKLLRDDVGFQLSFLAILGIIYFFPFFESLCGKYKIPKLKGVRDIIIITLCAQILTIPIVAYNFHIISVIAPVSNLLILWILPFLMVALIGGMALGFIIPPLAIIFFLPAKIMLLYIIKIPELLVRIPFAYIQIDHFSFGSLMVYYLLVGIICFHFYSKKLSKMRKIGKI